MRAGSGVRPVEKVLGRLEAVREMTGGWMALCPAHDDSEPSLSVKEGDDGRVLLNCFGGCGQDEVLGALEERGVGRRELFPGDEGEQGPQPPENASTLQRPGVSLEEYAAHKRLPPEHLTEVCRLEPMYYKNRPAVRMPYLDEEGQPACSRFRVSLEGKPKVVTKRGDKHTLYGRWRLDGAAREGRVVLVEGESDCHTLWHHGFPALGVPGASSWRPEWSEMLAGVDRIYAVVEPDAGGAALWDRLAASPVRERLYRVDLTALGAKDPSELHLADPGGFDEKFNAALADAVSWLEMDETEGQEKGRRARSRCEHLAGEPDILAAFEATMRGLNYAGDIKPAKILYLALTSRLLPEPRFLVNVVLKGPSSAGKSHTVETVLGFFPEEAYVYRTATSEKVLAYGRDPLAHRFLVYAEADGMSGETGALLVRSLLSEGRIRYAYVEKSDEGLREVVVEREGPTGLIVTTTRARLHPENETRLLSVRMDDSRAQTEQVLRMLAVEGVEGVDLGPWVALQEWLGWGERRVTIPFASKLVGNIPPVAVRLRRDVSTLLNLVRSNALLHREGRGRDGGGRIVATIEEDYATARGLVHDLMSENVESTVPSDVRETVRAVERLRGHGPENKPASQAQLARHLKLDKGAISHRVRKAIDAGYLGNLEDRRGRPAKLVAAEPMPDDEDLLPTVEALRRLTEGSPPASPAKSGRADEAPVGEEGPRSREGNGATPQSLSTLAAALRAYLSRYPRRRGEYPSWLATALWSENFVPCKPTPQDVEKALEELDGGLPSDNADTDREADD